MIDKTITPYPPMDSPTVIQPSGKADTSFSRSNADAFVFLSRIRGYQCGRRTPVERFCDDDDGDDEDVDGDVDGDDDDATNRTNTLQPCAFQGADGPISWGGG